MRIMKKKASTQQGNPVASGDRDKALETALAQIERQFGKGSVMRLGDDDRPPIEAIPTGAIALDVVVIDSVTALVPRSEIEGEMGDSHVGAHARLMSQALRKIAGAVAKSNTIIIFINQLREKVGVVYGNPEVTTGGRALKFFASMRIEVRRIEALKGPGNELIGNRTRAKIVKNKVAPPFKEAEFDILYGRGISKDGEVIDLGVKFGIIQKSGAWFYYGDLRLGQGRENAKETLLSNQEIYAEIEQKVTAALKEATEKSKVRRQPARPEPAAPAAAPAAPTTKAGARAKLDIVVDDDEA